MLFLHAPQQASSGFDNLQNPQTGEVNVKDLVDNHFIRKLDESVFFERIYGNPGR